IDGNTIVEPVAGATREQIATLKSTALANMMPSIIFDNDGLGALMAQVGRGPTTVGELVAANPVSAEKLRRSIGWLAKNDLVRLVQAPEPAPMVTETGKAAAKSKAAAKGSR